MEACLCVTSNVTRVHFDCHLPFSLPMWPEYMSLLIDCFRKMADLDIPEEAGHRVVATARGVFDSSGGVLESKETGGYTVEGL